MNRRLVIAFAMAAMLPCIAQTRADDEKKEGDDNARVPANAVRGPDDADQGGRGGRRDADQEGRRAERARAENDSREAGRAENRRGRIPGAEMMERLRGQAPVNARARTANEAGQREGAERMIESARGMMRGPGEMERLQHEDPEMFALAKADVDMENQTRQLVDQYHRAVGDADREQLRGKLAAVVENHFEVRQQRRVLEVKRLEAQLQRLRDSLRKRGEERQKIIEQHISQLLGADDTGF